MNIANMNKAFIHIHIIQFILFIFANIHEYSRIIIFLSEPYPAPGYLLRFPNANQNYGC